MTNSEGHLSLGKLLAGYDAEEKSKAAQRDLERLLTELLGIADVLHDLELHCTELQRKGVQDVPRKSVHVVRRMLMGVLKSHQVEPMNCKGQTFDLDKHEVLDTKSVCGGSDDIVLEENVHGYMWQQRVLRHAKVIISRAEAEPEPITKRKKRRQRGRKHSAANKETLL
jgi:molecular chaperone GrpE